MLKYRVGELIAGLLFGLGLILGGMTNPAKVIAFLDVSGQWDPSLAFVMMGAIAIGYFAFAYQKRVSQKISPVDLSAPQKIKIDWRLIVGSGIFGVGWGLSGFCPGPVFVAVIYGHLKACWFFLSMLLGMFLFERSKRFFP